jgi:hypothetical protein
MICFAFSILTLDFVLLIMGAWGGLVVKALRYKSEGPGVAGIFPVVCALGSTQPLKVSTRIILGLKAAGA